MKAILIDPKEGSVKQVEHDGSLQNMYDLLGCRTVDFVQTYPNGDGMYVDDEGLYVEDQHFFIHLNYPQPIAGKALILGTDDDGGSIAPDVSVQEVNEMVRWIGDKHNLMWIMNMVEKFAEVEPAGRA